jgi:peptidyl-prolyl cis-trans isomerase D
MSISNLLFSFEGRITRSQFWSYFGPYTLIYLALVGCTVFVPLLWLERLFGYLFIVFVFVTLYPCLAVAVKRCHDRGRSGWFVLVGLVPILGLWYAVEVCFLPGTPGPNKYDAESKPVPLGRIALIEVLVAALVAIAAVKGGVLDNYIPRNAALVRVGNQDITAEDVEQRAQMIARQQFRGNIPPTLMPLVMKRAAEMLIVQGALSYQADHMGLSASYAEMRDALHKGQLGQAFFPGGNFIGQKQYEQVIKDKLGLSAAQFERELTAQIAIEKLLAAVGASAGVSDQEITQLLQKQGTKVKFDYAVITLEDIKRNDPELAHVQVSPGDLQQYYTQHQDEFRVPETVTVRHILIKTPTPATDGKADQKAVDAAKAKAEDIQKQLKAGGDFAELAKKNSDDPGSAQNGGLLPPITRGRTVPEFEEAAFSTPVGQTTGLIHSNYGFHIIRVEGKQSARLMPFEEVKAQIEPVVVQQLQAQRARAILAQKTKELSDRAHSENDLKKAAKEVGATAKTSDFVEPSGQVPEIGPLTGSAAQIFNLKPGEMSGPIGLQSSGIVVLLIDKQVPSGDALKKDWDMAKEALLAQKRQELEGLYVQSLREHLEEQGKIKINKKEMERLTQGG